MAKTTKKFPANYLEEARNNSGKFVTRSAGSARTGYSQITMLQDDRSYDPLEGVPVDLCSSEIMTYQQGGNHYCLSYSMASALCYCGFPNAAEAIAQKARGMSAVPYLLAVDEISSIMENDKDAKVISQFKKFNFRSRNKKGRHTLSYQMLLEWRSVYPLLVILKGHLGRTDHAVCIVDDLIFDSIAPRALHLCHESFNYIFDTDSISVHQGWSFCRPKFGRLRYDRQLKEHPRNGSQLCVAGQDHK